MPSDSSNVDVALLTLLNADTPLLALMVDGAFMNVSPLDAHKAVEVSLVEHEDNYMFEGRAIERAVYRVKAVELALSSVNTDAAAARIDALLSPNPANFQPMTITGNVHMATQRTERIRYAEADDTNADLHWQHSGGLYELFVSQ